MTAPEIGVFLHGREYRIPVPEQAGGAEHAALSQAVYLSGLFQSPPLCSGQGRCGLCRMRFRPGSPHVPPPNRRDLEILGDQCRNGWRLGCGHSARPGQTVDLPDFITPAESADSLRADVSGNTAAAFHTRRKMNGPGSLAVDFGSTSVEYSRTRNTESASEKKPGEAGLVKTPETFGAGKMTNPQMGAGSDVISRLAWAARPGGFAAMSKLAQSALAGISRPEIRPQKLKGDRKSKCSAIRESVDEIVFAANPAMTYLFLGPEFPGADVSGLASAPYRLDYPGGDYAHIPGLPPVWICPMPAPFIGGDLSAGYASIALDPAKKEQLEYPFILADLGTNGEFLLALGERETLAASLPLGPALEGMGMSCGIQVNEQTLSQGIITSFSLSPNGLEPLTACSSGTDLSPAPPGKRHCAGISATGYLSLLDLLARTGIMDKTGRFTPNRSTPLSRVLTNHLRDGKFYIYLDDAGGGPYLGAGDVEELLKIKASFRLALKLLLQKSGLAAHSLKRVYLAGALGLHAPGQALANLGFMPGILGYKLTPVGNSSLSGALLLAARPRLRDELCLWSGHVDCLNLAEETEFMSDFASAMFF